MAVQKYTIELSWENGNAFEMKQKLNSEDTISIVKVEENAHIKETWAPTQAVCITQLTQILTLIGEEMKK